MTKTSKRRAAVAKRIGRRIKAAREARGWSQQELADRTGISRPQITLIENGDQQPRFERVETLAKALGVSAASLLSLE